MIRYLTQEEKERTKAMYRENFPEDSEAFLDYYYTYRTGDNEILVMEEAGLQVMIHLNPCQFRICGESGRINYVVAVATEASVRRQGKMARVLERALLDMAKEHQPFTFLIPANPRVYESAGFAFVPTEQYPEYEGRFPGEGFLENEAGRQRQDLQAAELGQETAGADGWLLQSRETAGTGVRPLQFLGDGKNGVRLRPAAEADIPAMVEFANGLLSREYDIYLDRTEEYYKRILAEMACQDGGLVLLEDNGAKMRENPQKRRNSEVPTGGPELAGIFSYGREEERIELQEILVLPEYREAFPALAEAWFSEKTARPDARPMEHKSGAVELSGHRYSLPAPVLSISRMDFMVRILDLKVLCLMLRSHEPFVLKVQVRDDVIAANEGSYEIRADREGSSIRRIDPSETEGTMEIGELAEFLFGKMRIFIREWV